MEKICPKVHVFPDYLFTTERTIHASYATHSPYALPPKKAEDAGYASSKGEYDYSSLNAGILSAVRAFRTIELSSGTIPPSSGISPIYEVDNIRSHLNYSGLHLALRPRMNDPLIAQGKANCSWDEAHFDP